MTISAKPKWRKTMSLDGKVKSPVDMTKQARSKPTETRGPQTPVPITIANLAAKTASAKRTIRILSAGAKGGPGKTFLCKNLAGCAAAEGYSVAVVDFDNQRSLTKWLGRRSTSSSDKAEIVGYTADPNNVADAMEVLALNIHDLIFFDTPPAIDQHSEVLKTLAYGVDLILVPSAVGIADTESAEILLKQLNAWKRPTLVVLNKVKPNATKVISTAKKRLVKNADLTTEIGEYYDFLSADEVGLGATEMGACVGKDDIEAVWNTVKRRSGLEG